jgi:hypothetical protein
VQRKSGVHKRATSAERTDIPNPSGFDAVFPVIMSRDVFLRACGAAAVCRNVRWCRKNLCYLIFKHMRKYANIGSSDRGVPYFFQECTFFKYQAISDLSGNIRLTVQYLRISGKIRSFRFKIEMKTPSPRLVGWACKTGLPRTSEFEFGCTGFDGLGLHGLGLVLTYTKYIHCK